MKGAANQLHLVYQVTEWEKDSGTALGKYVKHTPICGGALMQEPTL